MEAGPWPQPLMNNDTILTGKNGFPVNLVKPVKSVYALEGLNALDVEASERALRLECLYQDVHRLTRRWRPWTAVNALEALARR